MKRKNIDFIIGMTKDFIDGNLDFLTYCLDYNHELISRFDKMNQENSKLADMVHFYLFEEGFGTLDFAYHENEAGLRKLMKRQYKRLMQSMSEGIY